MGAALLYDFSPRSRLSPHILIGAGVVRSDIESTESMRANQAYGEVGVGLGWRLSRSLELAVDVRAGSRETSGDLDETSGASVDKFMGRIKKEMGGQTTPEFNRERREIKDT